MEKIIIEGQLTYNTVMLKKKDFFDAIQKHQADNLAVDMSQVNKADSAGLALMLEAKRFAQRQHKQLHFQFVPNHLCQLAQFNEVASILNLTP